MFSAAPGFQNLPSPDERIIGGHNTDITKHPWQVSVQLAKNHFCGGSLIKSQWIVTAAHCVDDEDDYKNLTVRLGSTNTTSGGQVIGIDKVILHPGWNFSETLQYDNDIALIKLSSPFTDTTAKTVSLPSASSTVPDGAIIVVTGWGSTSEGGKHSATLLEVEVPKVPLSQCKQLYSKTDSAISDVMLCAGDVSAGGKDACQGDSGGPATYKNQLVGIVSFGIGCALPQYPGVYSRVSKFIPWINSETK